MRGFQFLSFLSLRLWRFRGRGCPSAPGAKDLVKVLRGLRVLELDACRFWSLRCNNSRINAQCVWLGAHHTLGAYSYASIKKVNTHTHTHSRRISAFLSELTTNQNPKCPS